MIKGKMVTSVQSRLISVSNPLFVKAYYTYWNHRRKKYFSTLSEEVSDVREWIKSLPPDFDIVVGIPRTGLLTASIVAVEFGKPLSTPDLIVEGRYWLTKRIKNNLNLQSARILIVDDSIGEGETIRETVEYIRKYLPEASTEVAVTYVFPPSTEKSVDYYFKAFTDRQPIWRRGLAHGKYGVPIAFGIDGVLCEEPPADKKDYMIFIETAKPYKIPAYEIDFIITGRNELFRETTEKWLRENNVQYRELLMNSENENTVDFKSRMIRIKKPHLYVESSPSEALAIHRKTGCRILCIGNEKLYE